MQSFTDKEGGQLFQHVQLDSIFAATAVSHRHINPPLLATISVHTAKGENNLLYFQKSLCLEIFNFVHSTMTDISPIEFLQRSNDIDIADENSRRELIGVLKATKKEEYEDVLGRYAPSQQKLLRGFVDGQPLDDLARELPCDIPTAVGYQQNLEILDDAKETELTFSAPAGDGGYEPAELPITNDPEKKNPVLVSSHPPADASQLVLRNLTVLRER